jgi:hypothetical protein
MAMKRDLASRNGKKGNYINVSVNCTCVTVVSGISSILSTRS